MDKKSDKFIFWTPRVAVILFALFLALFSLDIFGNNYTFLETVVGLFMHNIPSLVLLVMLIISWKNELVGATIFGLLGTLGIIGFIIVTFMIPEDSRFNSVSIITGIVTLFVGILFFIGWKKKKALNSVKKETWDDTPASSFLRVKLRTDKSLARNSASGFSRKKFGFRSGNGATWNLRRLKRRFSIYW